MYTKEGGGEDQLPALRFLVRFDLHENGRPAEHDPNLFGVGFEKTVKTY